MARNQYAQARRIYDDKQDAESLARVIHEADRSRTPIGDLLEPITRHALNYESSTVLDALIDTGLIGLEFSSQVVGLKMIERKARRLPPIELLLFNTLAHRVLDGNQCHEIFIRYSPVQENYAIFPGAIHEGLAVPVVEDPFLDPFQVHPLPGKPLTQDGVRRILEDHGTLNSLCLGEGVFPYLCPRIATEIMDYWRRLRPGDVNVNVEVNVDVEEFLSGPSLTNICIRIENNAVEINIYDAIDPNFAFIPEKCIDLLSIPKGKSE